MNDILLQKLKEKHIEESIAAAQATLHNRQETDFFECVISKGKATEKKQTRKFLYVINSAQELRDYIERYRVIYTPRAGHTPAAIIIKGLA